MVIYHIHHHAETGLVEGPDHPLHFGDPNLSVEGVRGIAALGYIVVHGIVAPVVLVQIRPALVDRAVVKDRKQLYMGDPQGPDVIQARGSAVGEGGSGFRQTQELPLMADVGAMVDGQIPQVQFIDDRIGNGLPPVGISVILPPGGVGGGKIQDHGPAAVDTGGSGVGIAGLPAVYQVGIVHPVPISREGDAPGAPDIRLHGKFLQKVVRPGVAAAVQAYVNPGGSGRPESKAGFLPGPGGSQVGTGIGIGLLKAGRIVIVLHGSGISFV